MYLANITRLSGQDNMGGQIDLLVARKDDIESMPDPVATGIYGDITMKAGKSFYSWQASTETSRTKSSSRSTREGPARRNVLEFVIPKDRASIKSILDQAEDDEFVVIIMDGNASHKIFGTIDNPVKFEYDHDSGEKFADLNAYSCRFYYDGPDNLFHYDGTIPSAPTGTAPAIVRFNGVAIASLQPGETLNITSEFGFTEFYTSSIT